MGMLPGVGPPTLALLYPQPRGTFGVPSPPLPPRVGVPSLARPHSHTHTTTATPTQPHTHSHTHTHTATHTQSQPHPHSHTHAATTAPTQPHSHTHRGGGGGDIYLANHTLLVHTMYLLVSNHPRSTRVPKCRGSANFPTPPNCTFKGMVNNFVLY